MKRLMALLISGVLMAGGSAAFASPQDSVKQSTKDIGQDTKRAAKATGKKVKKTTKKVVHKGAKTTKKGAEKVESKTDTK
jgi:hypothetical protein